MRGVKQAGQSENDQPGGNRPGGRQPARCWWLRQRSVIHLTPAQNSQTVSRKPSARPLTVVDRPSCRQFWRRTNIDRMMLSLAMSRPAGWCRTG
jgi:hypothetical protein